MPAKMNLRADFRIVGQKAISGQSSLGGISGQSPTKSHQECKSVHSDGIQAAQFALDSANSGTDALKWS